MSYRKGFTIVELLIVIVVIGILAAIVIVAYQGVQTRARNVQMITTARVYVDALTRYGVAVGSYPKSEDGMDAGVCLGTGYPSNHCWAGSNGDYYTNDTFDSLMAEYAPSVKPTVSIKYYDVSPTDQRSGIAYMRRDGGFINYLLDGHNQNCQLAGATASNRGTTARTTVCEVFLPAL